MKKISFYKMQANGNDFIVVIAPDMPPPVEGKKIRALCDRHFGIGADGLIVLEKAEDADFIFHYYNMDGSRGEMCANGARCALRLARELQWTRRRGELLFKADDGLHRGRVTSEEVSVQILSATDIREHDAAQFSLPAGIKKVFSLNTGVPHVVLWLEADVAGFDLARWGAYLRYHDFFAPGGTNVDVFSPGPKGVSMRTYERGVEKETLSCGTGVAAVGLIFIKMIEPSATHVDIDMPGGPFRFEIHERKFWLRGPARIVFQGQILI